MKTSLKKLQKIAAVKHDRRAQKHPQSLPLDDFAKATQDMKDMRDCYDRLLSGAAATANSVYEFSESLREMGDCLLEKTALNDDEESGKVLLMLGKVQFELQKLLDGYRSHIFSTITIPSESLLNELRIVEEMKKCCDGKREIYDDLLKKQKEKGRLRNSKSECFTSPQLKEAYDEYDDEANVFVFRMKSLKQGQSHSFLTQASRHHAAQLYFFKNAVRSLEALEPHVKLIAEQHHIDCQFSGLKGNGHVIYGDDAESDGEGCSEDSSETHDDGELSSDYEHNVAPQEVATLKSSMELDTTDMKISAYPNLGVVKEIFRSSVENSFSFQRGARAISKSAPLFPEKKLDSTERMGQLGPSPSRKYTSYVLPTPDQTRSVGSWKVFNEAPPQTKNTDLDLSPPADQKYEKLGENVKMSGPIILNTHAVLMERSNPPKPSRLPPPLSETLSFKQLDPNVASYAKKAKRQAFSGPLIGKQWPNNSNVTASGPIASSAFSLPYSGSLIRTPIPRPTSTPKLSSRNFVSSPKISELHELPRPPAHVAVGRSSNCGSLISKSHELPTASISMASISVPVFPVPPLALSRSYSIPAGGPMDVALHVPLQGSQNLKMEDAISSPPFDPMSLRNIQSKSSTT